MTIGVSRERTFWRKLRVHKLLDGPYAYRVYILCVSQNERGFRRVYLWLKRPNKIDASFARQRCFGNFLERHSSPKIYNRVILRTFLKKHIKARCFLVGAFPISVLDCTLVHKNHTRAINFVLRAKIFQPRLTLTDGKLALQLFSFLSDATFIHILAACSTLFWMLVIDVESSVYAPILCQNDHNHCQINVGIPVTLRLLACQHC